VELAWATSSISQIHMLGFEPEEAIAWGERALAMAEQLGAEDVFVDTLNNLGSTYSQIGDWEKGLRLLEESVERAQALQSPADVCRSYCNLAVALQRQCCYDDSIGWFERLHAYSAGAYVKIYVAWARWRLMWINWDIGRWRAALAWRNQVIEMESNRHVIWTRRVEASMDMDLGQMAEPRQALEATLPGALRADDLQTTVPHLGQLVRVYGLAGQAQEARKTVELLLQCVARRPYPFVDCIMPLLFACQWLVTQTPATRIESAAEASTQLTACLSHLERLNALSQY
jgi:tetratricopeptide (TPR) repeat protein